ncbi:hypothetical protein VTN96DRAFT_9045 [Rasamsonia emersonii]
MACFIKLIRPGEYSISYQRRVLPRGGVFVHTGAWYDGWETRRHNPEPYDWVVIKLGVASGAIEGVEVDTAYFVGNYGEKAALQATYAPDVSDEEVAKPDYQGWTTILPLQPCGPSQRQAWKLDNYDPADPNPYTHVRLLMYPDGGFARLRLYGHAIPPPLPPAAASNPTARPVEELSSARCWEAWRSRRQINTTRRARTCCFQAGARTWVTGGRQRALGLQDTSTGR